MKKIGHKILIIESGGYSLEAVHYNIAFGMDYYDEIHVIGRYHRSYADVDVRFFSVPTEVYCPIAFYIAHNPDIILSATHVTYLADQIILPYKAIIETDDGIVFEENHSSPIAFASHVANPFVLVEEINYINNGEMVPALEMMYSDEKHNDIDRVLGKPILSKVCLAYFGYGFFTLSTQALVQASTTFVKNYKTMMSKLGKHIDLFWHILLSNIGPVSELRRTSLLALWGGYQDQKIEIMRLLSKYKSDYFEKLRGNIS